VNDFVFVQRHPAFLNDDFWFELDEYRRPGGEQFLLGHIRVHRFAPSVFKQIKHVWATFRRNVTAPIFACPEIDDQRWVKFVTALGFKPLQQIICNNGEVRPLYIHII
jgi:hypothetical protein